MLFANERKLSLSMPAKDKKGENTTVASLIDHLCEDLMKDARKDLFVLDGSV
jgi:ubiquitin related modifier 1